jgi:hypothetical protein
MKSTESIKDRKSKQSSSNCLAKAYHEIPTILLDIIYRIDNQIDNRLSHPVKIGRGHKEVQKRYNRME